MSLTNRNYSSRCVYILVVLPYSEWFVKNSQKVQQTITNLEQNLTTGESFKEYMNTKN